MTECYVCSEDAHELSERSACVRCECKRSKFNENENDELRVALAKAQHELDMLKSKVLAGRV